MRPADPELIGTIYEAAARPSRWLEVRSLLDRVLDAQVWIFFSGVVGVADGRGTFLGSDEQLRSHLTDGAEIDDPWHAFLKGREEGWAGIAERSLSADDLARSAFGEHVAGIPDYGGALFAILVNEGERLIVLGATVTGRTCTEDDVAALRQLVPHLARAARMTEQLREAEQHTSSLRRTVDLLHVSVLLVNPDLRMRWCNAPAASLLERGDPLRLDGGRLAGPDLAGTRRIEELVGSARSGEAAVLRIDGADGTTWCSLLATRIDGFDLAASSDVAIFASHSSRLRIDPDILCALHGLTRAEAEVTRLLASGHSTEEIAAERGVRQGTIRAQLKQIFAKTGCRTQADLVRTILTGPGVLRRD